MDVMDQLLAASRKAEEAIGTDAFDLRLEEFKLIRIVAVRETSEEAVLQFLKEHGELE
jgi:hypothetical protein